VTVIRTGTLVVPGAALHYKLRGSGPALLIIAGGGGDADASDGIAEILAERYTVLTYDRRGLSRSALDDPDEIMTIPTHGDDASHLLAEVVGEAAFVFGASLGALVALDLAARHPEQVRALVAHEPPLPRLLSDAERVEAERVQRAIEQGPRSPGWAEVLQRVKVDHADREPGVELGVPTEQRIANSRFFAARDAPAAHRFEPDVDALRARSVPIVAAGGHRSREGFPHRAARALAEVLDVEFAEFPGDHAGFATRPSAFAHRLAEVLEAAR
jgi:pimeloyl-ACP methyl ester carboxylesterase